MPLLSVDSRLVHFMETTFELLVLNLLTILFCIPVITIGPALTALYRSVFDMRQGKANIVKGYFNAFRANLRSGLFLGLIFILFVLSFSLYVFFFLDLIVAGDALVLAGILFVGILLIFPMTFVFPLLAIFDNSAWRTLSNAFLLSYRHLGTSLVIFVLFGFSLFTLILAPSWFFRFLPLWLLFGFSLPGWVASRLLLKIFSKYASF